MQKFFLLIAGFNYYPGSGTDDWRGTFYTEQDAMSAIVRNNYKYIINGQQYDWYEIIDLREWVNK